MSVLTAVLIAALLLPMVGKNSWMIQHHGRMAQFGPSRTSHQTLA
jgi:hypothetical protein